MRSEVSEGSKFEVGGVQGAGLTDGSLPGGVRGIAVIKNSSTSVQGLGVSKFKVLNREER